ncbi:MAG: hypothetical protein QOI81_1319 [Actinomycetota bacterium]|jgi:hypothetical protein|nr:hypothetical protein [Actinomycetota bacterium]
MTLRRFSLALVMTLTLGLGVTPAHAAQPIRGCPTTFQGPLDLATILILWPPPPDLQNPLEHLASVDLNGDQRLCVRPLQNGTITAVDNVVPFRST